MSALPKDKMRIAIKGIIGTGKSTVSEYIAKEYGYTIFNCDHAVHKLYEENIELQNTIVEKFELEEFSRKALGAIVFNDPEKLKELESIVFPYLISEYNKVNDENVVIDCQIIDKIDIEYDFSIICCSSMETIIKRVKERDNRSEEEIKKIVNIQNNTYRAVNRTWAIDTENDIESQLKKILGDKK